MSLFFLDDGGKKKRKNGTESQRREGAKREKRKASPVTKIAEVYFVVPSKEGREKREEVREGRKKNQRGYVPLLLLTSLGRGGKQTKKRGGKKK